MVECKNIEDENMCIIEFYIQVKHSKIHQMDLR
jgi:hypothetical protein